MSLLNESCPKLSIRLCSAPYITHQHIVYYIHIISSRRESTEEKKKQCVCVCVCRHIYHTVGCRNLDYICIERDAKVCNDALSSNIEDCPWIIHTQTSYSWELALQFHLCIFLWVRRDANQLAQELAKVARSLYLPFSCNLDSLPPSAKEAWTRDILLHSSYWNSHLTKKKKKKNLHIACTTNLISSVQLF